MNRLLIGLMVFASVGLLLSIVGMAMVLTWPRPQAQLVMLERDDAAIGLNVPEFELVDQEGRVRTQEMFEGRITILDFKFTQCPFACPRMTAETLALMDQLAGTDVQFVSVSVDPLRDTPGRLKKYAAEHGADTQRWTFLTGEMAMINRIATESLQFLVQPDERTPIALPDGTQMSNIIHPTKFILVGPDREVLGFYESTFEEDMEALARRARGAAKGLRR
jgi:protein SCO1